MANFSYNKSAIDQFINDLDNLADKVESLNGATVDFDILFNADFMTQHTKASTFDEFLAQGRFQVETEADFEAIPDEEFDNYVSSATNFKSWDEMLEAATDEYLEQQLDF